jgi:hypothetical protein
LVHSKMHSNRPMLQVLPLPTTYDVAQQSFRVCSVKLNITLWSCHLELSLFKKKKEIKRNVFIDVFILILCCQFDQQRRAIMINSYFISESELDSFRLGRIW